MKILFSRHIYGPDRLIPPALYVSVVNGLLQYKCWFSYLLLPTVFIIYFFSTIYRRMW